MQIIKNEEGNVVLTAEEFEEIKNEQYKNGYNDGERITKDLYRSDIVTMIKIFERLWR